MNDWEYASLPKDSELPLFGGSYVEPCSTSEALATEASDTEQDRQLRRVKGRTCDLITQFFDCHQVGETFHAEDLQRFVASRCDVAPASADRVMRDMRRSGQINYEVINRSQSLYRKLKT